MWPTLLFLLVNASVAQSIKFKKAVFSPLFPFAYLPHASQKILLKYLHTSEPMEKCVQSNSAELPQGASHLDYQWISSLHYYVFSFFSFLATLRHVEFLCQGRPGIRSKPSGKPCPAAAIPDPQPSVPGWGSISSPRAPEMVLILLHHSGNCCATMYFKSQSFRDDNDKTLYS